MIKNNKILEMFWPNAGRFQDQDSNSCQLGQKDKDPPSLGRTPSLPPLPEGAAESRPHPDHQRCWDQSVGGAENRTTSPHLEEEKYLTSNPKKREKREKKKKKCRVK